MSASAAVSGRSKGSPEQSWSVPQRQDHIGTAKPIDGSSPAPVVMSFAEAPTGHRDAFRFIAFGRRQVAASSVDAGVRRPQVSVSTWPFQPFSACGDGVPPHDCRFENRQPADRAVVEVEIAGGEAAWRSRSTFHPVIVPPAAPTASGFAVGLARRPPP